MPLLNMRLAQPAVLIDIGRLRELDYIRVEDGELRIGALVRQRALGDDPAVADWPLLREAARHIGHPATRNRGTVCGSIAHADPEAVAAALHPEGDIHGSGEYRRELAAVLTRRTLLKAAADAALGGR